MMKMNFLNLLMMKIFDRWISANVGTHEEGEEKMAFLYMNKREFEKWKETNPTYDQVDTNTWLTDLIASIRNHDEKAYLEGYQMRATLVFIRAEYLWEKETSQHFFNLLHDARSKKKLQTVLVIEIDEIKAAVFRMHMNISYALFKLADYHFHLPTCPASFDGDGYAYLSRLYEWKNQFGVNVNVEIGRMLSEINPKELPDRSIYTYQKDLGDYYISVGRREMALGTYIRGYFGITPSNYAYLKRWDYVLAIAEAYTADPTDSNAAEIHEGRLLAIHILNKLIGETEKWKDLEGAEGYHKLALLKKIMILGRKDFKEEGEELLKVNILWLKKAGENLKFLLEMMDIVDIYGDTSAGVEILQYLSEQSDQFQQFQLFDENRGIWIQEKKAENGVYSADDLRKKFNHIDLILHRFKF